MRKLIELLSPAIFMKNKKELSFNIGNISIPSKLTESRRAKHIRLIMDINGLRVIKPPRVKINEVEKLLRDKSNWIYKHYMNFQSIKAEEYNREWGSGEKILFKGNEYSIKIYTYKNKRTFIDFDGKLFDVYVNENAEESERKTMIENAFRNWYKKAAHESIQDRLDYYCRIIGLSYSTMRTKEQKTRWGSCSKKGNLNFNWKLIMSPQWVIDYVIVHEICHLRYMNHSKEYWKMVSLYVPEYKKAREWLNKKGTGLRL